MICFEYYLETGIYFTMCGHCAVVKVKMTMFSSILNILHIFITIFNKSPHHNNEIQINCKKLLHSHADITLEEKIVLKI